MYKIDPSRYNQFYEQHQSTDRIVSMYSCNSSDTRFLNDSTKYDIRIFIFLS